MSEGWAIYTDQFNNWNRQYGWRPFPSDLRSEYSQHRSQLEVQWEDDVAEGLLPPTPQFVDFYTRVDSAVDKALNKWTQQLTPGQLQHLRDAHNRICPRRRQGMKL